MGLWDFAATDLMTGRGTPTLIGRVRSKEGCVSKVARGLLIALIVILVLGVLGAIGFQAYERATHGQTARLGPVLRPGLGDGRFGFRGGLIPYRGLIPFGGYLGLAGLILLALLAALVIAALMSPEGNVPAKACARCGRDLQNGWVACPHCGQLVESASAGASAAGISEDSPAPVRKRRSRKGASA